MGNTNADINRKQAFEDYYKLPLLGIPRNPNRLYEWYLERLHNDPEDRARIPTTNRATVYKWYKEDDWVRQTIEREDSTRDASAQKYEDLRMHGFDKINLLITKATNALSDLLDTKDPKVRLQAVEATLDRAGLTRASGKDNRHTVGTPVEEKRGEDAPAEDATIDEMMQWLSNTAREDTEVNGKIK